jgi:hypothetical protein
MSAAAAHSGAFRRLLEREVGHGSFVSDWPLLQGARRLHPQALDEP